MHHAVRSAGAAPDRRGTLADQAQIELLRRIALNTGDARARFALGGVPEETFFPQIVSGPIQRPADFLSQLRAREVTAAAWASASRLSLTLSWLFRLTRRTWRLTSTS